MTGEKQILRYKEGSSRYDKKTYNMLEKFLKISTISTYFESINKSYNKNIYYLNKTRIKINEDCCNRFVKGKQYEEVNFLYNGKREKYKVCIDMPVMAAQNIKDEEIFNTMEFKIRGINNHTGSVNGAWFPMNEFSENVFQVSV